MKKLIHLLLAFVPIGLSAQTIIYVNSTIGNDASGTGSSGAPYKTFHKAYTTASSGDVIELSGTFTWTDADETGDATTDGYTISKNITIRGNCGTTTIVQASSTQNNGSINSRVFTIPAGYTVTIRDLTIRHGYLNTAVNYDGGGAIKNSGILIVDGCLITLNAVHTHNYQFGGGILNAGTGSLTIENSTISYNTSSGWAGGICHGNYGGPGALKLRNSVIHNNSAPGRAGALLLMICSQANEITNCTFYGNTSGSYGVLFNDRSTATYTNNTFVNNTCAGGGGAIYLYAGTMTIKNNLLANNAESGGIVSNDFRYQSGTVNDNGYNIIEYSANYTFTGTGDITGDQASLNLGSGLASNNTLNGTNTISLETGSIAINAGNAAINGTILPLVYDQRSYGRDGAVDIGAYEYSSTPVFRWMGSNSTDWNTSCNWRSKSLPSGSFQLAFDPLASTRDLQLDQDRTISLINFTGSNYKMILGSYDLTATTVSGADANSYLQANGTGSLKMNISNGSSVSFASGNAAYNPVTITNNTGSADDFSVRVVDEVYAGGTSGSPLTQSRVQKTWYIGKTNANGGSGINFSFNWNGGETSGTLSTPKLYHYGSSWTKQTGSTSSGANSLTYTGYTGSFSPFAVMDDNITLPVQWLSFTGQRQGSAVALNWSTATEEQSQYFIVQHKTGSSDWEEIGTVTAVGNSNTIQRYSFTHMQPGTGTNYYRLLQRDIDGHESYSRIITVLFTSSANSIQVYPNPAVNGVFKLELKKTETVIIMNQAGMPVYRRELAAGTHTLRLESLAKGIYRIKAGEETASLIIQ